jgi:hypothetical protein
MLLVTVLVGLACLVIGFNAAEYIYKKEAELLDDREDELFEGDEQN